MSLKELATRAAQAAPSRPASPIAISQTTPLPGDATNDDSGVIHLDAVHAATTSTNDARSDAGNDARTAAAASIADDKTFESAVNPAEVPAPPRPTKIAVVQGGKGRGGVITGVVVAVLGVAAAFAIVRWKEASPTSEPIAVTAPSAAIVVATTASTPVAPTTAAPPATATAEPAPVVRSEPEIKTPGPAKAASNAGTPATPAAPSVVASAPTDAKAAKSATPPSADKPGDLQAEMARAAGKDPDKAEPAAPKPEPAAAGIKDQNIPEQPSQGSVQAAMGIVMVNARACVAGADDVSRATVTFSSTGAVATVSVSGWAADHGKSGCIQSALKGAKVGPFSKPSFTVGVPIRP